MIAHRVIVQPERAEARQLRELLRVVQLREPVALQLHCLQRGQPVEAFDLRELVPDQDELLELLELRETGDATDVVAGQIELLPVGSRRVPTDAAAVKRSSGQHTP
eukprot:scaffold56327_cov68-Phaeocystis_antarctica.AAC.6